MAAPTYSPVGSVTLNVNLNASYATQMTSLPPVQTPYTQVITAVPASPAQYTTAGTGTGQINRIYLANGTLTSGAATSAAVLTMSSSLDISGQTTTSGHVREIMVFNDSTYPVPTTGYSTTSDANILLWDTSFTSSFGIGATSGYAPMVTSSVIQIPARSCARFSKPFGTTGWTWTSSNAVVALGVPSGSTNPDTIAYRVIVCGD